MIIFTLWQELWASFYSPSVVSDIRWGHLVHLFSVSVQAGAQIRIFSISCYIWNSLDKHILLLPADVPLNEHWRSRDDAFLSRFDLCRDSTRLAIWYCRFFLAKEKQKLNHSPRQTIYLEWCFRKLLCPYFGSRVEPRSNLAVSRKQIWGHVIAVGANIKMGSHQSCREKSDWKILTMWWKSHQSFRFLFFFFLHCLVALELFLSVDSMNIFRPSEMGLTKGWNHQNVLQFFK